MLVAVLALLAFAAPAQAVEYLSGGDFEGGTPVIEEEEGKVVGEGIDHPSWVESDDQYTSPICSSLLPECKSNSPQPIYGPRSGQAWALFGAYVESEQHDQTLSQAMTLPLVDGGVLSFYIWVGEFAREASLDLVFDQQRVALLQKKDLPAVGSAYQQLSFPIAGGGQIQAGPHTLVLKFVSDAAAPGPATALSVDDVSFTATPVPTVLTPGPGPVVTPPDTKITKVQLYRAKAGKTGSAKRPGFLKATQGKTGKAAKAKFFFSGSGGAGGLHFECRLDDAALKSCDSPIFYKRLKLGRHSFTVRAVDRAGNKDPTPATYQWKARTGKSGKTK